MTKTLQANHKSVWQRINKLFLALVAAPTLVSIVYFGLIASDVYVSESKFIIYNPQSPTPTTGLTGLLQGVGISNNSAYAANAVRNYLLSRDALQALQTKLQYQSLVSSPAIDPFNRFGGWLWFDTTFEQLYRYYTRMVDDTIGTSSNISTLQVQAYSSHAAQKINQELLTIAQQLVNRINARANQTAVAFYEHQVQISEAKVQAAATALATYRNQSKVFNPTPQAAIQAAIISKLESQRLTYEVQLGQLEKNAPQNPRTKQIKQAIADLEQQIKKQTEKVVGPTASLASKSANYDRLILKQGFAEKELAAAISSLYQAQTEAQKQTLFIETIVQPNLPDEALLPRRARNVLATFVVGLLLWGVFSVVVAGIREHNER